ncbi:MAG: hypothetical protein ACR2GY_13925 [Phycisphaerales bacterium]
MRRADAFTRCATKLLVAALLTIHATAAAGQRPPSEITPVECDDYARWLNLTSEQQVLLKDIWEHYRDTRFHTVVQQARAYYQRETEMIRHIQRTGGDTGKLAKELFPTLHAEKARVRQAILDFEETEFFANLAAILTPEQSLRMPRVRRGRERSIEQFYSPQLPEGNVDLTRLVDAIELTAEERDTLEREFIDLYEPAYIRFLRASNAAERARAREGWDIHSLQYRAKQTSDPLEVLAIHDQITAEEKRAGAIRIQSAEALVHHNRTSLAHLRALVADDPDLSATILQRYREMAYPHIYPDPADAASLYDAAFTVTDLGPDQHEAVRVLLEVFRDRHERISKRLADMYYTERYDGYRGDGRAMADAARQVIAIGLEREALNAMQLNALKGVLSPEQVTELSEWDFAAHPRPRPWDPDWRRLDDQRKRELERERLLEEFRTNPEKFRRPGSVREQQ